ncbi:MAG TPA: PIG-L family deacetylase [Terriglobales bacterium]|nr:PIG-L family deacetylase [Terriglobales bacterium]
MAGLKQLLVRLNTTARLMQTTAHPDDEDGGMLTLESRGKGVSEVLMTLTRGEGGQNKVGSNLFDVLGVLRSLELLASDRYYGVEQRFSRVADFGFSKTAEETFEKWGGHDVALADIVRVIRTFRPDVLIARFSGTERDGHGNHQASATLTQQAFRAAGDANRFPEQMKEGLQPWQAKKLYIGNVCPYRSNACDDKNYTLRLDTGQPSPALGMTYVQFAVEGLRHQLSQGGAGWTIDAGPHYTHYRLVDSVLPPTTDKAGHEQDFFDGIDTTLQALASRIGSEESTVPFLRPGLAKLQDDVNRATQAVDSDPLVTGRALLDGLQTSRHLINELEKAKLSANAQSTLLADLRAKQKQFEDAAVLALGLTMEATVEAPTGADPEHAFMAVPGQPFSVAIKLQNGGKEPVKIDRLELTVETATSQQKLDDDTGRELAPGDHTAGQLRITLSPQASYTKPYWHRDNPETESVEKIDQPQYVTLPFPPSPARVHAQYTFQGMQGELSVPVRVKYKEGSAGEEARDLAIAPAFSLSVEPSSMVIPVDHTRPTVKVNVASALSSPEGATVTLKTPSGWSADPPQMAAKVSGLDDENFDFRVSPGGLSEARHELRASLQYDGKEYAQGYTVVTREDLGTFYYYQPAVERVSVVSVKVPESLKVGYIMGAGDDIPTVLKQLGMDIALLPAEKIATADLSGFGTLVLGIRAYDTQKDLIANNKKLLDYVSAGGTLVVQYETAVSDFNSDHLTPYPAQLSRARVSVEQAPVELLAPDDLLFHYPNQVTEKDFDGWVQERGLYFMDQWDDHYKPLLACHDPGESPQKGGLLRAQYGKGTYIYTGYAFFRQLPAGVPGAVRLYVNLLSAGHERHEAVVGSR